MYAFSSLSTASRRFSCLLASTRRLGVLTALVLGLAASNLHAQIRPIPPVIVAPGGGGGRTDGGPCELENGRPSFGDFYSATSFTGEAAGIAVGDIDLDGNPDFVVANSNQDRVRIKYGDGEGGFWGTHTWVMGDGPTDVQIGDFNNDGYPDVIATNVYDSRVRIRWGAEFGAGESPLSNWSAWTTGDGPWRVAVGDLNGDGRDDFVTTNIYDNSLTVRRRLAAGGFDSQTIAIGDGANDVKLGDVDGDGDLDIVYPEGIHNATIKVRRNNGAGVFGAAVTSGMGNGHAENFHGIVLGDFNEDGRLDLIGSRNTHSLVRALGVGNGSFNNVVPAAIGNNPFQIETADFNLDGHLDITVSHVLGATQRTILLGQGNGNFFHAFNDELAYPNHGYDVGVGDFTGDGYPDVVFTALDEVYVLPSNPCEDDDDGGVIVPPVLGSFRRGDINADGAVDIGDPIGALGCFFLGQRCTSCADAADANDDGAANLGDAVYLLVFLFQGGEAPPAPGPRVCGTDPSRDTLGSCSYDACGGGRTIGGPDDLAPAPRRDEEIGLQLQIVFAE